MEGLLGMYFYDLLISFCYVLNILYIFRKFLCYSFHNSHVVKSESF